MGMASQHKATPLKRSLMYSNGPDTTTNIQNADG